MFVRMLSIQQAKLLVPLAIIYDGSLVVVVTAGGDHTIMLDIVEEPLDQIALAIEPAAERQGQGPRFGIGLGWRGALES